ncbi:uncharacterized protein LOC132312200 isoform X2 [Cornus florida]|uniref:uncharacterized protein LOC132312200 isoform X2 n=1 Tax=Cornus florida TaxID=4283 RepID=UPI002896E0BC|nr:uncharacterized protein LOC132312200 isoform X2 [Cornus florida]
MTRKVTRCTGNYSSKTPLIAGRGGERERRQVWKKFERLVRNLSLVAANVSLIGVYVAFRGSKLDHHLGFHPIWLPILLFIAHLAVTVILRMRRPFHPRQFFSGMIFKATADWLSMIFTGLITYQVSGSRRHYVSPSPGFDYYIFNCTNPLGVSSMLPELSFTGQQILDPSSSLTLNPNPNILDLILGGCNEPILVPPSSLKTLNTNSNLLDWQIVVAQALLALYSLAMATLLRPGLSYTPTDRLLYIVIFFSFHLYADLEYPCLAFGALSIYTFLLLCIEGYIEHRAQDAPDTQTLAQRAPVRRAAMRPQRQHQA